jgi:hypothetical protein
LIPVIVWELEVWTEERGTLLAAVKEGAELGVRSIRRE